MRHYIPYWFWHWFIRKGFGWLPSELGSVHLYWKDELFQDTSATTPVTADGQSIARINDQVNSNDVSQPTAGDRPTYETGEMNGRPVIRFTSDYLYHATVGGRAGNFTIFTVIGGN